jgi:flagellar protein FlaJ
MITGYIIFFVFLGVMIALGKFLVPTLGQVSLPGSGTPQTATNIAQQYKEMFMTLILIQGFFAGLIVGKMAEGAMISGIRHSFIMMFIGGLVFVMFG